MSWQEAWKKRFYSSRPGWVDGTAQFYELCRKYIPSGGDRGPKGVRILEVGAGPTNPTSAFLASLGETHGVDVTDEVKGNVHLASAAVVDPRGKYPFGDGEFDAVVSNYVVEHVEDPRAHMAEIRRVLRPGGTYIFRTPNQFHYVALVSRFASHGTHLLLANRLRNLEADAHDPWPTVYAMNTPAAVRRYAREAGFSVEVLDMVEKEPSYGMYARPLFLGFMAYERAVNASERLARFRANMFVALRRGS